MTPDEHQRERMRHWSRAFASTMQHRTFVDADIALAEFDKRFPAPAAVGVATGTREDRSRSYDEAFNDGWRTAQRAAVPPADPEYESLRTKARYWDALESARVRITHQFDGTWTVDHDAMPVAPRYETLREAVQAAIDAGALK